MKIKEKKKLIRKPNETSLKKYSKCKEKALELDSLRAKFSIKACPY